MAASTLRFNTGIVTGTLNTVSNASVTGSNVFIGTSFQKVEHLSAYLIVTAATASITVKPFWQVSNDGTTFQTLAPDSLVSLQLAVVTGTANVTKAVPAPQKIEGYRYARCMLLVGGATGAAGDLFSIGYSYRQHYA